MEQSLFEIALLALRKSPLASCMFLPRDVCVALVLISSGRLVRASRIVDSKDENAKSGGGVCGELRGPEARQ